MARTREQIIQTIRGLLSKTVTKGCTAAEAEAAAAKVQQLMLEHQLSIVEGDGRKQESCKSTYCG